MHRFILMKTKKTSKLSKIFAITICTVAFFLTFTMADLFSSLITVGGFTFTSNDIYLPKHSLFAIYTATSNTQSTAETNAAICKNGGGAGYIYMDDKNFYIFASIYENEEDAKKVLSNIKPTYKTSDVLKIDILSINLSSNLETQEKKTMENCLNAFINSYKKLYDISISLDTSIINEINARLSINELGSDVSKLYSNFNTLFTSLTNSNLVRIKSALEELLNCIDYLIKNSNTEPYTSSIKNTYCEIVNIYKKLSEDLQDK